MKTNILTILSIIVASATFTSCSEDETFSDIVIESEENSGSRRGDPEEPGKPNLNESTPDSSDSDVKPDFKRRR